MLKTKALQPLLSCVSVPAPARKVPGWVLVPGAACCILHGAVSVSPAGSHLSLLPRQRAASPGERDRGVPSTIAGPAGGAWAWGWLGALRGGLSRALAPLAVSQCPLCSHPLPHSHGAILDKQLLLEKKQ